MSSAATIVRDARRRAGLSQAQLAAEAGIEQSVVSAYETGKREPGFETLRKLVGAAGYELAIDLVTSPPRSRLQRALMLHRVELLRTLTDLGASRIRVFGSTARGEDGPDSDIDLVVDVDDSVGLFALAAMNDEAERILGVRVDVVPSNSVKPAFADQIFAEAVDV